jgi:hypothetical protein
MKNKIFFKKFPRISNKAILLMRGKFWKQKYFDLKKAIEIPSGGRSERCTVFVRPSEIVLGGPWNETVDIWSIGPLV